MNKQTRINKKIGELGIATRKEADKLIKNGLVFINNRIAKLGEIVSENDKITINKKNTDLIYLAYNKPSGVETIATNKQEKDILKISGIKEKVFPVGRLDKDSEGLIILTNDGRVTRNLLNPKNNFEKEYLVELDKPVSDIMMRKLRDGVVIGKKEKTNKSKVRKKDSNTIEIVLTEGKNRQIRRMVGAFGYNVKKLKRFRIENILLKNLKTNTFRKIKDSELNDFLKTLKID